MDKASVEAYPEATAEEYEYKMVGKSRTDSSTEEKTAYSKEVRREFLPDSFF